MRAGQLLDPPGQRRLDVALDGRVSNLIEQFSKLDGINKDMRGLFAKLRGEVDAQLTTFDPGPK